MPNHVYKICNKLEWSNIKKKKKFVGTKKDLLDGFIHLSEKKQIKSTLIKHFKNKKNLILLKINTSRLKNLIWEKSQDGFIFPHLYSSISLNDVNSSYKIILKKNNLNIILQKN
jgi:uncharacterized protein (DUF952 family)